MDVELNDRRVPYTAIAGQTVYDIDFPIETADDFIVYVNGSVLASSNYITDTENLTVTLLTPSALGDSVVIEGNTQPVRSTAYPLSGALSSSLLNADVRKLLYIVQELATKVGRSVSLAQNEVSGISQRLPKAETGKMLKWGAGGLVNSDSSIDSLDDAVNAAEVAQMAAESAAASADADAISAAASASAAAASAAGMKWRPTVKAATTANITLSGPQTIDGVSCVAGDRVLVRAQSTAAQNGVYIVAAGVWSRSTDADSWTELIGQVVIAEEGSTYADQAFICTVNSGGTLGTTAVTWSSFNPPLADGAVSTAAKIVDGIITYAKMATAAIASSAETIAGTANKLVSAAGLLAALPSMVPFTKSYTSGNQTITSAGSVPLTHGLGAVPKLIQCELVCQTAELGYSVGDVTIINPSLSAAAASNSGHAITWDATTITVRYGANAGSTYDVIRKDTGVRSGITNANWSLRVKAWA